MAYRTPKHVQEQKDAKYKHILDVALRLFADKGYQNTLIQDICNSEGISVGSIYFYFPNKKSIFDAVYANINSDYLKSVEEAIRGETDLRQMILKSTRVAVNSVKSNVYVTNFFLTNSHLADLKMKRNDCYAHVCIWIDVISLHFIISVIASLLIVTLEINIKLLSIFL